MSLKQTKERDFEVVYLPKNLNIEEHLHSDLPLVKHYAANPDKVVERIAVVLGQIFHRRIFNKDLGDAFISLNARILQRLVRDYRAIINWALQVGIIETDKKYVEGKKSTGYRFTSEYWQISRKHYIYDAKLIRGLRGARVRKQSVKQLPKLFQYLQEIEIDEAGAFKAMDKLYHLEASEGNAEAAEVKRSNRQASIEMLHQKRFCFSRDTTVGRLHTNITSLKREARDYLTWKGQKLSYADIKNSQPYFSLCLLNPRAYETLDTPSLINTYNPTHCEHITYMLCTFHDIWITYGVGAGGGVWVRGGKDVGLYIDSVGGGYLYDLLGKHAGLDREAAKALVFNIFFSPPAWEFKGKEAFTDLFPNVWEVFASVNAGFTRTKAQGRKADDPSNTLALVLQRVESTVILDHIVPRIVTERPDLPIWTIHDSILTLEDSVKYVSVVIRNECERLLGRAPTVQY